MTLDRDLARALADSGYMGAKEYLMEHGEVPATADPVGVSDAVLNAFLDAPGSLENSLAAAVGELRTENEKLRNALTLLVRDVQDYAAWQRPCFALDEARAALGEQP